MMEKRLKLILLILVVVFGFAWAFYAIRASTSLVRLKHDLNDPAKWRQAPEPPKRT